MKLIAIKETPHRNSPWQVTCRLPSRPVHVSRWPTKKEALAWRKDVRTLSTFDITDMSLPEALKCHRVSAGTGFSMWELIATGLKLLLEKQAKAGAVTSA